MIRIKFTGNYQKDLEELLLDSPIRKEIDERVKIFAGNPQDTRLENHALGKYMEGKYAFSIDKDIRIVYEWIGKSTVRFLAIGRHSKVYSQNQN